MNNEKRVVVVFLKSWRGYSKGEKAGFDQDQVDSLIEGGVVELVTAGKPSGKPAASGSSRNTAKSGAGKVGDVSPVDAANTSGDASPADADAVNADADDEPKP